jgi:hypothetical protein
MRSEKLGRGLCAASEPLRLPGPVAQAIDEIDARLDALARGLEEARAAAATAREGDPGALAELTGTVDAMAAELAALKSATASTRLG